MVVAAVSGAGHRPVPRTPHPQRPRHDHHRRPSRAATDPFAVLTTEAMIDCVDSLATPANGAAAMAAATGRPSGSRLA
jgi:hypothetical protein